MKAKYTVSPRPNLYFDGDEQVIQWFMDGIKGRWVGPHALMIRDNGTPQSVPVTKMEAADFIHVVGTYNYRVTKEEIKEQLDWFWLRTFGDR
jgi:hypothetical protein